MSAEKMTIAKNYLGQKGYSIYKKNLSITEQNSLRQSLMVAPYMPKSPVKPIPYPIFLESSGKLYIPRFFGIDTFGIPPLIKITLGAPIDIKFKGELRDYQSKIINVYIDYIAKMEKDSMNGPGDGEDGKKSSKGGGGLLDIPCGRGKTIMALKILAELGRKTLIIVHKEFLLNQWIERIEQFIPDAKIGVIKGKIIDVEDKDIVLGMLQSLSMKEYPQELFKDFGLLIVDECHHISAEIFVRALQKIVTFYTLGLSATMVRKDGLTKVFKMFLGDIVYKEKRDNSDAVLVKVIKYENNDEEFSEEERDYRGNLKYSTMISKLCSFSFRTEFIINVIENELKIKKDQQILLLAHNKNMLTYIFKAIEHRKITSVGYYVGGMKEKDLNISATKQLIVATYSMAAEALDIKSLSTLILASPKTDIVQAVGRILRVKQEQPLVIDILDQHDVFRKQYLKRRTFYIQNKYKIIETSNTLYLSQSKEGPDKIYTTIFDPVLNIKLPRASSKKKIAKDTKWGELELELEPEPIIEFNEEITLLSERSKKHICLIDI